MLQNRRGINRLSIGDRLSIGESLNIAAVKFSNEREKQGDSVSGKSLYKQQAY